MGCLDEFIVFEVKEIKEGITLIHFELRRGFEPQDLIGISPPYLVKNRFSKNVVVGSHTKEINVGDLIKLEG